MSAAVTPLPKTVTTALHEGVPTILSRPKILRRIKTAPSFGRKQDTLPHNKIDTTVSDPLRLLGRVETSDGFLGIRNRIARKGSAALFSASQQKVEKEIPNYLALNPLEAYEIRANLKQQAVDRCKLFNAGNNERCSESVKRWLENFTSKEEEEKDAG